MTVIVHIGHGKTGSSYLQTMLARKRRELEALGYKYPSSPSVRNSMSAAKRAKVSSGNGIQLNDQSFDLPTSKKATVFSNEGLFQTLLQDNRIEQLINRANSRGENLKVILYTRNALSLAASSWGQFIKKGGGDISYEQWLAKGKLPHYETVLAWMKTSDELGFELQVFNYSVHQENIWKHFVENGLGITGVETEDLKKENHTVNRSLTIAEYEFQRLFNKYSMMKTSGFISDPLVNDNPDIVSETPYVSLHTYQDFVNRKAGVINQINARLPEEEKVVVEDYNKLNLSSETTSDTSYYFTTNQLETLARSICGKIESDAQRISKLEKMLPVAHLAAEQSRASKSTLQTVHARLRKYLSRCFTAAK